MRYIATILCSAVLAAAHGFVEQATIGGQVYRFYDPYSDPYKNPVPELVSRSIPGNGPVEDVNSPAIQCNTGSKPAALHASVRAGETVNLKWTLWPESHVGPVMTYMAKCPDSGCNNWQPSGNVWFKIQEAGRQGTSTTWASTPLMKAGNSGVSYTIPSCISPGNYLVRHETIALHASNSYPGAQFYPGCHQLRVTGGGSTKPSNLVAFPGAYAGTDPGVTYNAYQAQSYIIPGPPVFRC